MREMFIDFFVSLVIVLLAFGISLIDTYEDRLKLGRAFAKQINISGLNEKQEAKIAEIIINFHRNIFNVRIFKKRKKANNNNSEESIFNELN